MCVSVKYYTIVVTTCYYFFTTFYCIVTSIYSDYYFLLRLYDFLLLFYRAKNVKKITTKLLQIYCKLLHDYYLQIFLPQKILFFFPTKCY
jgi:hypothetical protein